MTSGIRKFKVLYMNMRTEGIQTFVQLKVQKHEKNITNMRSNEHTHIHSLCCLWFQKIF